MSFSSKYLLHENGLRTTACRTKVLQEFIGKGHALSHSDLEASLDMQFDRVTLYRTINAFLKKGIIHKVLDDSGSAKYALCSDNCSTHEHHDNHVHFKCTACNTSECLNDLSIPEIELPTGYLISESNLLIEGICSNCSKA